MKPTINGIADDLSRLKSRVIRSYSKGEMKTEQMQSIIKLVEDIDKKSNEYLRGSATIEE